MLQILEPIWQCFRSHSQLDAVQQIILQYFLWNLICVKNNSKEQKYGILLH